MLDTPVQVQRPGITLTTPAIQTNPYPTFALLRQNYPVCQLEPDGLWAISRYTDIKAALLDPSTFSSSAYNSMYTSDWLAEDCRCPRFIVAQDPPEHSFYRRLVNKAFIGRVINSLIPLMQTTSENLIHEIPSETEINFPDVFSYPYIGTIIGRIMGTGEKQNLDELKHWIALEELNRPVQPSQEFITQFESVIRQQNKHFREIIAERRAVPRADLISELVHAEIEGHQLSDNQLCSALSLLITAGFQTTIQMLNNAVIELARQPDLFTKLRHNPSLIPTFIEELLRFRPAVKAILRRTTKAVTLHNIRIPENALVMLLLASANRDPSVFNNPDTFDLHRTNIRQHLSFGHGLHICIGEALARLEIKIALETLLTRFTEIHCPPEATLPWTNSMFTHGLQALPVHFV